MLAGAANPPSVPMESSALPHALSATAALTVGLAGQDEAAFRQFHGEYFDRLFRYHLVVARGDEQIAREAVQETFIRVARHAKRFDDAHAFWCWLTVVAQSAAVDAGRRRQRYWALLKNYALGWLRPTPAAAPDRESELHEQLDQALASLPTADRTLLEAKYFGRASVRELAQGAGCTEKALESRLLRLRRQLRETILKNLHHEKSR
jgi:RNA polymerase sigma factor (sigma-70 family)